MVRPLCDRRALPTNLLPFFSLMRSSSDVRAKTKPKKTKITIIDQIENNLFIFITSTWVTIDLNIVRLVFQIKFTTWFDLIFRLIFNVISIHVDLLLISVLNIKIWTLKVIVFVWTNFDQLIKKRPNATRLDDKIARSTATVVKVHKMLASISLPTLEWWGKRRA